jgi:hypothetical protein
MIAPRIVSICLVVGAAAAPAAAAQGSAFGSLGLGLPGRAVSARDAGLGGSVAALDGTGTANPAGLGFLRGISGWAVGAPHWRSFDGTSVDASYRATRFPLFGFASSIRPRLTVGVTIGDYLDRNWSVSVRDTLIIRGDTVPYTDYSTSLGGISDMRLAGAWRINDRTSVGLGVHAILGSTRLSVVRDFEHADYQDFIDVSLTDFRAVGVSAGIVATPSPALRLGASVRAGGRMRADNTTGDDVYVSLPAEAQAGASWSFVPGVAASATAKFSSFSRASTSLVANGQAPLRDTWSLGVGVEIDRTSLLVLRTPLRLGYRVRQLPAPVGGAHLGERAFSAGISLSLAQGRTMVDAAFESGSREAGALNESFRTVFLGVTVRP